MLAFIENECNRGPDAGPVASRTRSRVQADGSRALSKVSAWIPRAAADERDAILGALQAFGGRVARSAEAATHAILPTRLCTTSCPEGLQSELVQLRMQGVPVVAVTWLEQVLASVGTDPLDAALLAEHTPRFLQRLGDGASDRAQPGAGKRRRLSQKTASALTGNAATAGLASPEGPAAAAGPDAPPVGDHSGLTGSLKETLDFLRTEHPEDVEAGQLRLAIERSLLDCAITLQKVHWSTAAVPVATCVEPKEAPEEVLGVPAGAAAEQIRSAYRQRVLETHPDRGGDCMSFLRVRRAYLALAQQEGGTPLPGPGHPAVSPPPLPLPASGARADFEMRDHRALVKSCFDRHGEDLSEHIARQRRVLKALKLHSCDVGAVNRNERGETICNQCFYLSLAKSYLAASSPSLKEVRELALILKRVVEAAVLSAHPDWGGCRVGEDVQAFSDFLFFSLNSHSLLSELCIAVFDVVSGGVEIFRGAHYPGHACEDEQRANTLTVQHLSSHYQALLPSSSSLRPGLQNLRRSLEEGGVLYVITDG